MRAPTGGASRKVTVVEVGPRDGLQNERGLVPTVEKIAFVESLADAGLPVIEVTAFVSPRAVPQLADAAEVLTSLKRREGVRYPVLVPNEKGLARAVAAGAREVAIFTAASESFNRKNINASIDESFLRFAPVMSGARREGIPVRGYVSCAFGCPYEGDVPPSRAAAVVLRLYALGCREVSIGDTIGMGVPAQVADVVGLTVLAGVPLAAVALHFHDTRGTAIANVVEGLRTGVRIFDSSAGGLGGCPFAPGATGNLATEDLLWLLERSGWETGADLAVVAAATRRISTVLGREPSSRVFAALGSRPAPGATVDRPETPS